MPRWWCLDCFVSYSCGPQPHNSPSSTLLAADTQWYKRGCTELHRQCGVWSCPIQHTGGTRQAVFTVTKGKSASGFEIKLRVVFSPSSSPS